VLFVSSIGRHRTHRYVVSLLYMSTCASCILSSTFLPHRPHLRGPENERETSFKDELISRATELVKAHGNTSLWCIANDGRGWLCLLFDEEEEKLLSRCAQIFVENLVTCQLGCYGTSNSTICISRHFTPNAPLAL
jgi:hypothetical protein